MTSTPTQRTTDLAEHLSTRLPGMGHERIPRLPHEERVDLVPGCAPSLPSTELFFPGPSKIPVPVSEPLPKPRGGFDIISKDGTWHFPSSHLIFPQERGQNLRLCRGPFIYMDWQVTAMPKLCIIRLERPAALFVLFQSPCLPGISPCID